MTIKTLPLLPADRAHAVELSSVVVVNGEHVKVSGTSEVCDCCLNAWNYQDVVGYLPTHSNLCPLCMLKVLNRVAESAHAW